jgi:hypothetical protein
MFDFLNAGARDRQSVPRYERCCSALLPSNPLAHTHSHTHTHTLSLSLSLARSLVRSLAYRLSSSRGPGCTISIDHSGSLLLRSPLCRMMVPPSSETAGQPPSHTHTHTHTIHTPPPPPPHSRTHTLTALVHLHALARTYHAHMQASFTIVHTRMMRIPTFGSPRTSSST